MEKRTYIQTENNTANLVELLLLELKELKAKVCTIVPSHDPEQFYTEEQAAGFLGISKKQLYNVRKAGEIHYRVIKGSIKYSTSDIEEYQNGCRR